MPRKRRTARKTLTPEQEWELTFAWGGQCTHRPDIGPRPDCQGIGCWSAFDSDEEREEAYWANHDRLIAGLNVGVRPPAWWVYEAAGVCRHEPRCETPGEGGERTAWLDRHGALDARERATLVRWGELEAGG